MGVAKQRYNARFEAVMKNAFDDDYTLDTLRRLTADLLAIVRSLTREVPLATVASHL
jgi:hypothetical protein